MHMNASVRIIFHMNAVPFAVVQPDTFGHVLDTDAVFGRLFSGHRECVGLHAATIVPDIDLQYGRLPDPNADHALIVQSVQTVDDAVSTNG